MQNDEMLERIARIIRENLSGVTSTDPDIRAAQEDGLIKTASLIADLCASGQVRASDKRICAAPAPCLPAEGGGDD